VSCIGLPFLGQPTSPLDFRLDQGHVTVTSGNRNCVLEGVLDPTWTEALRLQLEKQVAKNWEVLEASNDGDAVTDGKPTVGFRALPECASHILSSVDQDKFLECWAALVRLASISIGVLANEFKSDASAQLRLPLFHRLLFLLLSEQYRGAELDLPSQRLPFNDHDNEFAFRTKTARNVWAQFILSSEQVVVLAADSEGYWIEDEARRLVFRCIQPASHSLKKSVGQAAATEKPSDETPGVGRTQARLTRTVVREGLQAPPLLDISAPYSDQLQQVRSIREKELFLEYFLREFFLRRLMIGVPALTLHSLTRTRLGRFIQVVTLLLIAFVLISPGILATGLIPEYVISLSLLGKLWLILAAYLVANTIIFVAIIRHSQLYSYPFCLRLQGSAVLGVFALATLGTAWAVSVTSSHLWISSLMLLASAGAFLAVQAKNHGAKGAAAIRRAGAVLAMGWFHAVGISAMAFAFQFPGFYASQLSTIQSSVLARSLTCGAAIALSMGVFLQVLWEDRPASYPLGRLAWRGADRIHG
jgi:hypothetical protein